MRVDVRQREVSKHEAEARFELPLDRLDRPESLPRVRALVVPVLNEERRTSGPRTWSTVGSIAWSVEVFSIIGSVTGATAERAAKAHLDMRKEESLVTLPTTSNAVASPPDTTSDTVAMRCVLQAAYTAWSLWLLATGIVLLM